MSARACIAAALGTCLAAAGCDYNKQLEECAKAELCTIEGPQPVLRFPHNGFGLGSASAITQLAWGPTRPYLTWDFDGGPDWTFRVQLNKCPPGQSLTQCPFLDEISTGKPDAAGTTYTWEQDLAIGSRYWWRVRACLGTRPGRPCGPWSAPRYFDVGRPEALPNDIAGTGRGDLAIGQENPLNGGFADQVHLYLGGNTAPSPWFNLDVGPPGAIALSYRPIVAGAGDLNGDGYSDLAVGYDIHYTGGTEQPTPVDVYLSSSAGPQLSDRVTLGPNDGEFGLGLGRAGDINGDGLSDLVVCQPLRKRAVVYFGRSPRPTNSTDGDVQLPLDSSDVSRPACAFAALADVDSDGHDDIAVSASGQLRIFHGNESTGAWSDAFNVSPSGSSAGFGASLAGGDFNGDGHGDLVVEGGDGNAYLYLGNPQWFQGAPPTAIPFTVDPGMVVPVGDVNNDGFADLAVGGRGTGAVRVYFGQATGAPRPGPSLTGSLQGFATTVAGVGDVTDDTYDDVLVGGTDGVIVFRGGPSDSEVGSFTNTLLPSMNGENFGSSAASGY